MPATGLANRVPTLMPTHHSWHLHHSQSQHFSQDVPKANLQVAAVVTGAAWDTASPCVDLLCTQDVLGLVPEGYGPVLHAL